MSGITYGAFEGLRRKAEAAGEMAKAASNDEQVTRKRVDHLEKHATQVGALLGRGFWGRMRWLVLGK